PTPDAQHQGRPIENTKRQVLDRLGANPLPSTSDTAAPHVSNGAPVPVASSRSPAPTTAGIAWRPMLARAGVAGAAAMVIFLATVVGARGARRLRHRKAGPGGAWSEVLDLLTLLNRPPPRWQTALGTAAELAQLAPVRPARPHVHPNAHPALRL